MFIIFLILKFFAQLQDWNNRRQFTSPSNFHADGVNDLFSSQVFSLPLIFKVIGWKLKLLFCIILIILFPQAVIENTRANEILKQAPFLIPFTSRVKIFSVRIFFDFDFVSGYLCIIYLRQITATASKVLEFLHIITCHWSINILVYTLQ